ncbi:MAG TPA: PspC domain-containing protein [Candidatus Limnocylindria bacterium]|jgi:phage shock protein PspC (stress-responsive transcriptional regulator)|nr:PspC domain-containing protein [Candidatus Limnocylindria bacterium]
MQSPRLERSTTNRVIGGVCGGIAEYLQIDATLVRFFFVLATIFTAGAFLIVYIGLLILMPLPGRPAPLGPGSSTSAAAGASGADPAATAPATPPAPVDPAVRAAEDERRRTLFGYVLIAVGIAFFLGTAGVFRAVQWQYIWPLVLIGLGVLVLMQRVRV